MQDQEDILSGENVNEGSSTALSLAKLKRNLNPSSALGVSSNARNSSHLLSPIGEGKEPDLDDGRERKNHTALAHIGDLPANQTAQDYED